MLRCEPLKSGFLQGLFYCVWALQEGKINNAGVLYAAPPLMLAYTRDGYSMTRTCEPSAVAGRLLRNFARTAPFEPWARTILPHLTRKRVPFFGTLP